MQYPLELSKWAITALRKETKLPLQIRERRAKREMESDTAFFPKGTLSLLWNTQVSSRIRTKKTFMFYIFHKTGTYLYITNLEVLSFWEVKSKWWLMFQWYNIFSRNIIISAFLNYLDVSVSSPTRKNYNSDEQLSLLDTSFPALKNLD